MMIIDRSILLIMQAIVHPERTHQKKRSVLNLTLTPPQGFLTVLDELSASSGPASQPRLYCPTLSMLQRRTL